LKVSVVVIAKNAEKTIYDCLNSIFEQTRKPDEVIVVDGRSKDKTREIAEKFPVKIIVAPIRDTYGTSRNLGVKEAKGEIVAFLDSDDRADKRWLENLTSAFSEGDVGIAGSKRIYVYPHSWFSEFKWDLLGGRKRRSRSEKELVKVESLVSRKLIPIKPFGKHLGTSGSAYRKEAIKTAGYFDEDMFFGCEDMDLAIRIIKRGYRAVLVPEAKIYFNVAASVKEWFKESFYRRGMGYGALRRKHGHYKPPIITPSFTLMFVLGLATGWVWNFPALTLLTITVALAFLLFKVWRYTSKTGKPHYSVIYTILEIFQRNIIFLGFLMGFLLSPKTLRRIMKGKH